MSEWFENEDFWTTYAPIMFDDNLWQEAPVVAEYVKKIAKLHDNSTVLDAGCGLGRISVELAALGLDVTGVDIIQNELDAAKDSADAEGVPLKLIKADLRDFIQKENFDCALSLYTSFGYCDTKEEDFLILSNIYESLKKNGYFILECVSRETAIMYFTKGENFERAGFQVETEFKVSGLWEGLISKWVLTTQDNKRIEHVFTQRLYPAEELRNKLLEIGYSEVNVYGDFDYSPYDEKARTMIIVAKK